MTASHEVRNSRNQLVTTVEAGTADITTPLTFLGKGYAGVAKPHNENFLHLMENFASGTAPTDPVLGMEWWDTAEGLKVWDGSAWQLLATARTAHVFLTRLSTANNVPLTTPGSTALYTGPAGVTTLVSEIILRPRSGVSVASNVAPPIIALEVSSNTGDVADNIPVAKLDSTAKIWRKVIEGSQRMVGATETVSINVKQALAGPNVLSVDVYLLGIKF